MSRKTDPAIERAAKALCEYSAAEWAGAPSWWRKLIVAKVRRILRAAGRGGREISRYENLRGHLIITIDAGPAGRKSYD